MSAGCNSFADRLLAVAILDNHKQTGGVTSFIVGMPTYGTATIVAYCKFSLE